MAGRQPPREDRRVIAIQMLPAAYIEIQKLKGEETWTKFIIECVLAKVGDNDTLKDELAGLIAEAEARQVKAEKPKKPKAEKPKADPPKVEPRTLPAPTEDKVTNTPMRAQKKGKTLQELQAINK